MISARSRRARRAPALVGVFTVASAVLAPGVALAGTAPPSTVVPDAGATKTVTWTGTIPAGSSNPTGTCRAQAQLSDTTDVALTLPTGLYTSATTTAVWTIAYTASDPVGENDEILALLDPAGTAVATADETNAGQASANETVTTTDPVAGTWKVRACGFSSTTAQPYTGTLVLTSKAKSGGGGGGTTGTTGTTGTIPPAPTQPGAPTYGNYPAPSNQGQDAGEPSIGFDSTTGSALFQAGVQTERVTFSGDPAAPIAAWTDVSYATTSVSTLDPILATDRRTNRTFVSQLAGVCSLSASTDDGGKNYRPSQGCGAGTLYDHQTIGGGPYPPASPLKTAAAAAGYADAVYYCAQADYTATCARSDTGGATFGNGVPLYTNLDCTTLHGHVRVNPVTGAAFVPNFNCGGQAAVITSLDAGVTWTIHKIPGSTTQDESDPSVVSDDGGTTYVGWEDGADDAVGSKAMVAVSTDDGLTWSKTTDVGKPFGIKNVQFPELIAGDAGRASYAFLGTPQGGSDRVSTLPGEFHLYIATTYDAGTTWTTVDATPNAPVQRGGINLQGLSAVGGAGTAAKRNLLDFNDITLDDQGRVLVGWADGCVDACELDATKNGYTARGTITRQLTGKTLRAQFDAPAVDVPETPYTVLLPLAGLSILGVFVALRRHA